MPFCLFFFFFFFFFFCFFFCCFWVWGGGGPPRKKKKKWFFFFCFFFFFFFFAPPKMGFFFFSIHHFLGERNHAIRFFFFKLPHLGFFLKTAQKSMLTTAPSFWGGTPPGKTPFKLRPPFSNDPWKNLTIAVLLFFPAPYALSEKGVNLQIHSFFQIFFLKKKKKNKSQKSQPSNTAKKNGLFVVKKKG